MESRKRLGAIVVGAGLMGRWHAQAIERSGGTIVAVVDTQGERARELSARHRESRAVDDLSSALQTLRSDVVHLCTPGETHVGLAEQSFAAGCHVVAEKPLAPNAAATERLIDLAGSAGLLVCPVHQFVFQRAMRRARRLAAAIAPLRHLDFVACSAGGAGRPAATQDAIVRDILPHPLSLFACFSGNPIGSIDWRTLHSAPGELRVWGAADETTMTMTVSLSGRPTRNTLRIIGAAGTIHVDLFHGFAVLERGAVSRAHKAMRPFTHTTATWWAAAVNISLRAARREPAYPGLQELIGDFYRAVRNGEPGPISGAETIEVARARDMVIRRMQGGEGLDI